MFYDLKRFMSNTSEMEAKTTKLASANPSGRVRISPVASSQSSSGLPSQSPSGQLSQTSRQRLNGASQQALLPKANSQASSQAGVLNIDDLNDEDEDEFTIEEEITAPNRSSHVWMNFKSFWVNFLGYFVS